MNMHFDYQCTNVHACGEDRITTTHWHSDGGGKVSYMAHHSVTCHSNEVLRNWVLKSKRGDALIEYTCCAPVYGLGACTSKMTPPSAEEGGLNSFVIQHHNVSCETGTVMQGWQYIREKAKGLFMFNYTCCEGPA